jgi:uncharacterized OB-fold protein
MNQTCPKCGSDKIIPDARLSDQGFVDASVMQRPWAVFFRYPTTVEVMAAICGACGHIELQANNPELLWEAYTRRQKQRAKPGD